MRKFATLFYWQRQHCWLRAICFRRRCRAIFWHADNDCRSNNNDDGSTDYNYDDDGCADDNNFSFDDGCTDYDDGCTDYDDDCCTNNYFDDCCTNNYFDDCCADDNNFSFDDGCAYYDDISLDDCCANNNSKSNDNNGEKYYLQRLDRFAVVIFSGTGWKIHNGSVGDMPKQDEQRDLPWNALGYSII
jgi:hypothetical protein